MHICVKQIRPYSFQMTACHLFGSKPLSPDALRDYLRQCFNLSTTGTWFLQFTAFTCCRVIFVKYLDRKNPDAWKHSRHLTEISWIANCFKVLANANLISPKITIRNPQRTPLIFRPPLKGAVGIMFSGCPSVQIPKYHLTWVCCPSDQPWPF